ncbi:MAG TPA: prohibitin family protein [Candidatus Peregrinibacteria bacterium]|nr:prohibitin family protein [Candidatus Peregrinibacteria bacterium]
MGQILFYLFIILIFGWRIIPILVVFILVKEYFVPYLKRSRYGEITKEKKKSSRQNIFINNQPLIMEDLRQFITFKRILGFLILIILVVIVIDGLVSVPAGHVGIIYDRGRGVLKEELPEGLHLKIPFWQVATLMDIRTQEFTMSMTPGEGIVYSDDSMSAPTADGQTVTVDATVLFHVDPEKASTLYQTVGKNYIQKIVRPTSRGQIRMVISRYTAIDIYSSKRVEAETEMSTDISKILIEKGIILERVLLRNVSFGADYARAIEEKQIAQQRIQKAEYQRQEAEKLKEKKIIEASAEAEAIRLKGDQLRASPAVIQFEFVQKMADDVNWGILPTGAVPFLDLKSLVK